LKTAETLAKEHGVNESTIRRDGKKFEAMEKLEAVSNLHTAKTTETPAKERDVIPGRRSA
jgi:DeoR/GlpR family transcriptional regulator of sugar metabolism